MGQRVGETEGIELIDNAVRTVNCRINTLDSSDLRLGGLGTVKSGLDTENTGVRTV